MISSYIGDEEIQTSEAWTTPQTYGSIAITDGASITITSQVVANNASVTNSSTLIIDGGELYVNSLTIESGNTLIIRNG